MTKNQTPGAARVVPRTRGATSGLLLMLLGLWGALIPFIGPYFNFSYTPDAAWTWSAARGWLEVAPGAAAFLGGLLLLMSASRTTTLLGAWLGVLAGAWFVVGPQLETSWHIGSPGVPAGSSQGIRTLEALAMFSLLGVVIGYLAATAFGRLSVVSVRDARAAARRETAATEAVAAADTGHRREVVAPTESEMPRHAQDQTRRSDPSTAAPAYGDPGSGQVSDGPESGRQGYDAPGSGAPGSGGQVYGAPGSGAPGSGNAAEGHPVADDPSVLPPTSTDPTASGMRRPPRQR